MLATLMIPAMVLIIPQYVTVIDLPILHINLLDSPFAIWLPAVANAFNIFLLKRFFDSIPEDLMAAAIMDGASPLRTLWSIILPMSRPILGVVSIFAVTAVWKDFLWPKLVMPSPETRTISVGIYAFSGGTPMNVVVAAAVIAAIPTIIFFLIFQKNIMSGLTAGQPQGIAARHRHGSAIRPMPHSTEFDRDTGSRSAVAEHRDRRAGRGALGDGRLVAIAPSSTRSTRAASPTATATASATWAASGPTWTTWPTSASTRCGSTPGTPRRRPTPATTWPTTAPSTRCSARSPRPRS